MSTYTNSDERLKALKKCKTLDSFIPFQVKRNPEAVALCQYSRTEKAWKDVTYEALHREVQTWRKAFTALDLPRGARVAILLNNSTVAVYADQAVLANAHIPVPLHAIDTPGSSAFIMIDSQSSALVTSEARWKALKETGVPMPDLKTVVLVDAAESQTAHEHIRVLTQDEFLALGKGIKKLPKGPEAEDLAAIVYTSGTTGKPKGVMLTHKNIVENVFYSLVHVNPYPLEKSKFLSFLPLSHTFERTAGYYLPLATGCTIVYNRSIMLLSEDFKTIKPDVLISVPRIYEKIYARINDQLSKGSWVVEALFHAAVNVGWRKYCAENKMPVEPSKWARFDKYTYPVLKKLVADKVANQFGGRLKIAISGGAALNGKVARVFAALGLAPIQGYGMTETSPIIAGNDLHLNQPDTVGVPFKNVQIRLAPETNEIQVKGTTVMKGYWHRPEDTAKVLSEDGWLSTGDIGEINKDGLLKIRGRIKEIIVTSTGEKVPPVDLELALETDPLFSQTYVVGENKPFISCITVLNPDEWKKLAAELKVSVDETSLKLTQVRNAVLKRVKAAAADFPHYALPRNVVLTLKPWTIDNGFLTPTLKLKRRILEKFFKKEIDELYDKHKN